MRDNNSPQSRKGRGEIKRGVWKGIEFYVNNIPIFLFKRGPTPNPSQEGNL